MSYKTRVLGELYKPGFKAYLQKGPGIISPWHDVPITTGKNGIYNMIVEIPRWSNGKLEISKSEPLSPIVQDVKKGKLRFVANLFPFKGYIHNYGAFPQTWENAEVPDTHTGYKRDDDPLDVCEIGSQVGHIGEVRPVKVLGALGLIDEGETDWKVIAISTSDPMAKQLDDLNDVNKHMPGLLDATHTWFADYKLADGKPRNKFAGEPQGPEFAQRLIADCHQLWRDKYGSDISDESLETDELSNEILSLSEQLDINEPLFNEGFFYAK